MLNINATINGENFKEVSIPEVKYTYKYLKDILKEQFAISTDNEIEVYDDNNSEISKIKLDSNCPMNLKIALINKRHRKGPIEKTKLFNEDGTEIVNVLKDDISIHRYNCSSASCRKTFKDASKLFTHIKIHFRNKPFQ